MHPHLEEQLGALDGFNKALAESGCDVGGAVAQQLVVHVAIKHVQCILSKAAGSRTHLQNAEPCKMDQKVSDRTDKRKAEIFITEMACLAWDAEIISVLLEALDPEQRGALSCIYGLPCE